MKYGACGHHRWGVNMEFLRQARAVHQVDGLFKLIQVLLKVNMQVSTHGGRCNAFTRADKQRIVELGTQSL
ncbi:hypothetical protein D3C78_1850210 [compost metagenome]